jgi:uncharacterized protein (DUF362 family)
MLGRRDFLRWLAMISSIPFSECLYKEEIAKEKQGVLEETPIITSKVYVIKTENREEGIKKLMRYSGLSNLSGNEVVIKANYNSADPFPASTHLHTLSAIVDFLKEKGASVIIAERSGMGDTEEVLKRMGVLKLADKKEFDIVILDDLRAEDWIRE